MGKPGAGLCAFRDGEGAAGALKKVGNRSFGNAMPVGVREVKVGGSKEPGLEPRRTSRK